MKSEFKSNRNNHGNYKTLYDSAKSSEDQADSKYFYRKC